ncbi:basic amino acid/polyamine antiporter [Orrella marina]|uniref:basic amino acid/polyamine antiporter n=1 Tax=Orrella marina TaxID=2163011 RepID=UPI001D1307E3|nr:basic amino acid/polyamine antiporter [Orrella marina]
MASQSKVDAGPHIEQKIGLFALVAVVVSSMIGSGVDSLPQNMAQQSAVGPVVIAWIICGFGMYFIARTFIVLSDVRPDLQAGIYMYAREGFGSLAAFLVAWGYWLMTLFSNVAFAVMVMDVMDYFMPGDFTGGNNVASIIGASLLIWGFHSLVLRGTMIAGSINFIGTVAKLIPLVFFVGIVVYYLDSAELFQNVWGTHPAVHEKPLGSITSQVLAPLYVALWCFIGVEGAVALSGRARNKADVGRATFIGFVISLVICLLVSVLPFGVLSQPALSAIDNPSTAGVMNYLMGTWAEWFISAGVLVSILSSWLAWTMICAEIPMVAAINGTFPKKFATKNQHGAASSALWISSSIMQVILLMVYFAKHAWLDLLAISAITVLPAYFAASLFLCKLSLEQKRANQELAGKSLTFTTGLIGVGFCLFMLFASSFDDVAMTPLLLTLGIPFYFVARKEQGLSASSLHKWEWMGLAVLGVVDLIVIALFVSGKLVL